MKNRFTINKIDFLQDIEYYGLDPRTIIYPFKDISDKHLKIFLTNIYDDDIYSIHPFLSSEKCFDKFCLSRKFVVCNESNIDLLFDFLTVQFIKLYKSTELPDKAKLVFLVNKVEIYPPPLQDLLLNGFNFELFRSS